MIPGLAALVSPETLLEMQIIRLFPDLLCQKLGRPTVSET